LINKVFFALRQTFKSGGKGNPFEEVRSAAWFEAIAEKVKVESLRIIIENFWSNLPAIIVLYIVRKR